MHNILSTILQTKKSELKKKKQSRFLKLFNKKFVIIGELKFASPTHKILGDVHTLSDRAKLYEKAGVDAISVITEQTVFNGHIEHVQKIKKTVLLPILQKDFVIDPYQVYEARLLGGDALLFIARIVPLPLLKDLVSLALNLGLEPVVEVNNKKDLEKAVQTQTRIIAVNARNLQTLSVNVQKACSLLRQIPNAYIKLGFSGIQSREEVEAYKRSGAHGVLIGTALMQASSVKAFLRGVAI